MKNGAGTTMARKRKTALPPAGGGPTTILSVRMSPEYRAVLSRLAEHERCGVADVIDRAIADYARKVKFTESFPKRVT
jgi:hypothetical protein